MRLSRLTAGVLTTGALMFTVPAMASASAATAAEGPSATPSAFAMVADGQTVAQVQQEMGSAGIVGYDEPGTPGVVNSAEVLQWNDSSLGVLGGVAKFSVTFNAPAGQPLIVSSKSAVGL